MIARWLVLLGLCWAGAAGAAEVLAQGAWSKADYEVAGRWQIVERDGRLVVQLDEAFETKHGPDLHLLLSPRPFARADNDNAAEGALIAGLLQSTDDSRFFRKMKGAQEFVLPSGTRLADYRSILIHCVRFSHLWAGADLPGAN